MRDDRSQWADPFLPSHFKNVKLYLPFPHTQGGYLTSPTQEWPDPFNTGLTYLNLFHMSSHAKSIQTNEVGGECGARPALRRTLRFSNSCRIYTRKIHCVKHSPYIGYLAVRKEPISKKCCQRILSNKLQ